MSNDLSIKFDASEIVRFANRMAGMNAPLIMGRAINHTGAKVKTAVIRELTKQTGLSRKVIVKAVKTRNASYTKEGGGDGWRLYTRGGDISYKYFKPCETRAGVVVSPAGHRMVLTHAFFKGGQFPNRVTLSKGGGHVFARAGKGRLPIVKQVSDVSIPKSLVSAATVQAFNNIISTDLEKRVEHEINYALQTGGF
ncbi:hypothetical protein ACQVP2_28285 [Methylobacterium aquaticum]|uniref:hypothetical protein n=1 Tax=Methylobacterium aquaticum TaxID=270351 RepID=UPI003D183E8C